MSNSSAYSNGPTPINDNVLIKRPYTQPVFSINPERVKFQWGSRMAEGKISLLDGDPGLGKSTLTLEIAARVTRGESLPGGEPLEPRGVLILSAEDGEADTIRPRLEVANADLKKAFIFKMRDENGNFHPAIIPDDLGALEDTLDTTNAGLIIIDPFMAFLSGEKNANRDQDVRQSLSPLASMAERHGCAVLILRHLNKSAGSSAIYRGGGSIGITGAARFAMVVGKHPEDPTGVQRILMSVKNNLGAPPPSLIYSLVGVPGTDVAKVEWHGEANISTQKLLETDKTDYERTVHREARVWLSEQLEDGAIPVRDLQASAKRDGLYWRVIEQAKADLGIVSRRDGFGKGAAYVWSFPILTKPPVSNGKEAVTQSLDDDHEWPS
jgi:hypothetical protein